MHDRATLLALASKVEAATGPDRELDVEIFRALGHEVEWRPVNYIMELRPVINWKAPHVCAGMKEPCPEPTASLDAALSLVPEGWVTADANNLNIPSNNGGWAWALDNGEDCGHPRFRDAVAKARTPALALTAAALRALAQEAPGDDH